MRRILVDARVGWGSGIGRYITNTVPLVAALQSESQFDVVVNEQDLASAEQEFGSLPNVAIRMSSIMPFTFQEQTSFSRLSQGYDLTWFTNYWVPQNWRGRYIVTVHDLLHLRRDLFTASLLRRASAWLTFRKIARGASGISFASRFSQREFESRFGTVEVSRVHHCGLDHVGWPMFDPQKPPRKERLVLTVGATKRHKNFDIVLKAWNRSELAKDWSLVVVSPDGLLRSSIDLHALHTGARPVEFLQGVSNDELRELYRRAAVFLMPSLYEGFGIPLMEAMQAGAICVSSNADALIEVSQGGFLNVVGGHDLDGWVEALHSSCGLVDRDADCLAVLQTHNMQYASRFRWHKVAEATTDLISHALRA